LQEVSVDATKVISNTSNRFQELVKINLY
jgi:hypothetical protein